MIRQMPLGNIALQHVIQNICTKVWWCFLMISCTFWRSRKKLLNSPKLSCGFKRNLPEGLTLSYCDKRMQVTNHPKCDILMCLDWTRTIFTRRQSAYFESWFEMRILNHDSKYCILDRVYAKSRRDSWFEMRNSKTPLDRDLRCASQITNLDVIWRTHGPKYRILNRDSRCATRIKIQNTHFAVMWKQPKIAYSSSRLCFEQEHPSCWKMFKSRHHIAQCIDVNVIWKTHFAQNKKISLPWLACFCQSMEVQIMNQWINGYFKAQR